ncbi:hypothetical protein EAE96_003424 [Botrytis aclada]|nr:hypothetical protein EAE96_003424 [Botrytis aclada]
MSAYSRLRPDLQRREPFSTQEAPNYLYLCVLERENARPYQYDFTLATGNASDIGSLTRHDLVDICSCVATMACGQVGLSYHPSRLRHCSQKVLTMIQIAEVKNQNLLRDALCKCDPEIDRLGSTNWYLKALDTLIWENRTGRILDIYWEFSFGKLHDAAERFTSVSIVLGRIVEGDGNELVEDGQIRVFDMADYSEVTGL